MDNTPLLDLVRWVCARWQLHPKRGTGDTKYGTIPNIVGLEQMGILAYLPTADFSHRTKFYPADRFQYDAEQDQYICPQGQTLRLSSRRKSEQVYVYAADAAVCNACPVKHECTDKPEWSSYLPFVLSGVSQPCQGIPGDRGLSESHAQTGIVDGTLIRGSEAVPPDEKVSFTRFDESEYRRRIDSNRTKSQKID
jgi:hypothetical protein